MFRDMLSQRRPCNYPRAADGSHHAQKSPHMAGRSPCPRQLGNFRVTVCDPNFQIADSALVSGDDALGAVGACLALRFNWVIYPFVSIPLRSVLIALWRSGLLRRWHARHQIADAAFLPLFR